MLSADNIKRLEDCISLLHQVVESEDVHSLEGLVYDFEIEYMYLMNQ